MAPGPGLHTQMFRHLDKFFYNAIGYWFYSILTEVYKEYEIIHIIIEAVIDRDGCSNPNVPIQGHKNAW